MTPLSLRSRELLGCFVVFLSTVAFYLATVVMKIGTNDYPVHHEAFILGRFVVGLFVTALLYVRKRQLPRSQETFFMWARAITNYIAVYFFFLAVEETTVATANIPLTI